MPPILLIAGLVALAVVGFFFVRRIPKGGAHRKKPQATPASNQSSSDLEDPWREYRQPSQPSTHDEEPGGDWIQFAEEGLLPGVNFIVQAMRDGGPETVNLMKVFSQMSSDAARNMALERAGQVVESMLDADARPEQIVRTLETVLGRPERRRANSYSGRNSRVNPRNPWNAEE